ncbi:hypothetical protein JOQ06_007849, partial [Pogonophryne albipinna]
LSEPGNQPRRFCFGTPSFHRRAFQSNKELSDPYHKRRQFYEAAGDLSVNLASFGLGIGEREVWLQPSPAPGFWCWKISIYETPSLTLVDHIESFPDRLIVSY